MSDDRVAYGFYTCAVIVSDSDMARAEEKIKAVESVINGLGFTTIREGVNAVEAWLGSLPADLVEKTPWLLYWNGACRLPFDPIGCRHYFEQAFERFRAIKDAAGTFLSWSGFVDATTWAQEDFRVFDQWTLLLEELMEEFEIFPSEEIETEWFFSFG